MSSSDLYFLPCLFSSAFGACKQEKELLLLLLLPPTCNLPQDESPTPVAAAWVPGVPTLLWEACSIALRIADPEVKADVGFVVAAGGDEEGGGELEGSVLLLLLCTGPAPLK